MVQACARVVDGAHLTAGTVTQFMFTEFLVQEHSGGPQAGPLPLGPTTAQGEVESEQVNP